MRISVKVKPNSKAGPKVEKLSDTDFVVYIREKPKDGEANTALIKILADYFDVSKTSIKIKTGATSRQKIIEL